jgi:hypothetical protein
VIIAQSDIHRNITLSQCPFHIFTHLNFPIPVLYTLSMLVNLTIEFQPLHLGINIAPPRRTFRLGRFDVPAHWVNLFVAFGIPLQRKLMAVKLGGLVTQLVPSLVLTNGELAPVMWGLGVMAFGFGVVECAI